MANVDGTEREDAAAEREPWEPSAAGAVLAQLDDLKRRAGAFPTREQEHLLEALDQLAAAMEAMQTARADLRRQNEDLSASQSMVDAERRRYRELFDTAPQAYIVTDPDSNIEELNQAAARLLGWRQKGLVGKSLASYVAPGKRREFRRRLDELRTVPRIEDWSVPMRTVSGGSVMASITVEAVRESDQWVGGLRWVIRDVAKEAAARDQIQKELSFRRALVESQSEASVDGILVVDTDGSIVTSNRRFAEMWGISDDLIAMGSDEAALAAVADSLADPEGFRQRVADLYANPLEESRDEILLKDGRVFDRFSAPVTGPGGEALGRVWFFRDVTEEHRQRDEREELLQTTQAARTDAEAAAAHLHKLQAITDVMLRHVGVEDLLNGLLDAVREALGTDAATILLLTPDGKNLAVRAVSGEDDRVRGEIRVPLGKGIAGRIASDRSPRVVDNVPAAGPYSKALRTKVKSLVGVPLMVGDRVIGVVHATTVTPHRFTEEDVQLLELVAERAAVAIENAELYEAEHRARRNAELAQLRLAFLAESGVILSGALQIPDALESLARLSVTFLTDLCLIDVLQEDGSIRRMAAVHADPEKQHLADLLQSRFAPDPFGPHPAVEVMKTGRSLFAPEMPEDFLRQITRDAEHLAVAKELGFQSYVSVPLVTRDRVRGAFTLVSCDPHRRYGEADVALAEDLARRAAFAMENADLYEAAVKARREAEGAAERTAALQSVSAALAEAMTPPEVAEVIVERGLSGLSATAGSIVLYTEDRSELFLLRSFGYADEVIEPWRRFANDLPVPIAEAARSGQAVFLSSPAEAAERFPILSSGAVTGNQAWASIPLTVEGQTIGSMGLSFPEQRTFSEEEQTFMLALARQCAQALERARLYEAEKAARTEAEQAEDRLAFLAEASELLASSLDVDITLASIARLAVPRLADWCSIDLLDEDGSLRQVAVSHRNPSKEAVARELRERYPPERDPPHAIWRVLLSGEPELAQEISDHELVARATDPLHVKLLREVGIRSHIIVPLRARGRTLGAISLIRGDSGRRYHHDELVLAEDLGRRAAIAIDNSGLYHAEQTARASAERAGDRLAFLSEATISLSAAVPDFEAMLDRVARLAVPTLGDICVIDVIGPDGSLRRIAARHADPDRQEQVDTLRESLPRPSQLHPVLTAMATGEPQIIPDLAERVRGPARREPDHLDSLEALGATSVMILPLRARERNLGALTLAAAGSRHRYTRDDVTLAEELARRAGLVVDNARLYELQRNIARTLQRSLLPATLPDIPGMELAARYRAAGEGNEVGGDFYDAFETAEGAWILTIGDVCGKGPEAAAVTGLARHTLRAVAFHEQRPSRVLGQLNDAILRELGDERFCTVCCIRLRPSQGAVRVTVCAGGHPLPIVLRADGSLETAGRPSMLLGVLPQVELTDHVLDLWPGDAIVLYTDGVIEEDRAAEEPGTVRLARILQDCAGADATTIAEAVERSVIEQGPGAPRDDVAVLVLRVR